MATFIPVPGTAKVAMVSTLNLQQMINTFHFKLTAGEWDAAGLNSLCEAVWNWYHDNIRPIQTNIAVMIRCTAVSLQSSTAASGAYSATPAAGAVSSPYVPNNVALVATLRTALRGRSYRGRFYLGGIPQAQLSGANYIADSYAATFRTAMLALMTDADIAALEATWGVVSLRHDNAARSTGVFTPITTVDVDPTIDSQRRRLPGRGA